MDMPFLADTSRTKLTPKEMKEWLELLVEWGVPEDKAKKILLRSQDFLYADETNSVFTNSELLGRSRAQGLTQS